MLRETLELGPSAAAEWVARHYQVDERSVRADLDGFLADLARRRLLTAPFGSQHAAGVAPRLAPLFLAPLRQLVQGGLGSLEATVWALLSLGYISFHLFGWSVTVETWRQCSGRLGGATALQSTRELADWLDQATRTVASSHLLNIGCKERALCCWTLARAAGLPAQLVLGIDLFPLASHCWCEIDSHVLSDYRGIAALASPQFFDTAELQEGRGQPMRPGFCVTSQPQGVELRLFGPSRGTRTSLVNVARTPDSAAVLMGRLYYHSELISSPLSGCQSGGSTAYPATPRSPSRLISRPAGLV